jgi:hypothetical protein
MKRAILTVFCAVAAASWGGCSRSIPILTVEELLANPQDHSHTMVKVRGCFVSEFEKAVLQPCESQNQGQNIWVEEAMFYEQINELGRNHPEFKGPAPVKLLFEYDKGREKRAWKALTDSLGQKQRTSEIILLGQFETIAPHAPRANEGFGHLDAYPHELILVDVLSRKSNTTR